MVKKRNLIILGLASMTLLTGCGKEETLVCTNNQTQNGLSVDQEISMTFKNNKINLIKMVVDSKATDDSIKENWSVFAQAMDKQYKDKKEEGITLKLTNNDKDYTYKVALDVELDKVSEKSLAEYNLSSITKSNENLKDVQKSAEDDGFKCKVK